MSDLLFEIGSEEIPARFLPLAAESLLKIAREQLASNNISFEAINVYVTPRRLAFIAEGIPENQADVSREVWGPPKKNAFDARGKPTKAAIGFAKSVSVAPESLVIKERNSGEYVAALVEEKGRPVKDVLPEILKKMVLALHFPKSMRWGDGTLRFVRPIKWLLAVLDSDVMEFELDGLKSSNVTKGHRFLSPVAFQIKEPKAYKSILETSFVIADQEKRKQVITGELEKLSASVEGTYIKDEDLLNLVSNLVEYPVGVLCGFQAEYLELPEELLITVMKDHQKYFAVRGADGKLLNSFIVISNTLKENAPAVSMGAERVIRARFEDARFYYQDDLKKPLASKVKELKKVIYHEKLGTLYEKALRIKRLALFIANKMDAGLAEKAEKAAMLAKADLLSGVVREFPELQGVMGKYYAAHDGEGPQIARSIYEQYLPRHAGDVLPETPLGTVLALADRIDNIASFFSIGLAPTGSEDPFALRRQAIGVCTILFEKNYPFTIKDLLQEGMDVVGLADDSKLLSDLIKFFEARLVQILEARGYEADLINSVMETATASPLNEITKRLEALGNFIKAPVFPAFLLAIKRVRNIIPGAELPGMDEALLIEKEEKELYGELLRMGPKIGGLLAQRDYEGAMLAFAEITGPVNNFFDKVLVMAKEERVKNNRLALLSRIWKLALRMADFSSISERA
jgi:glycyl-tRNA synthetase beta chain